MHASSWNSPPYGIPRFRRLLAAQERLPPLWDKAALQPCQDAFKSEEALLQDFLEIISNNEVKRCATFIATFLSFVLLIPCVSL
jgi:hypothetical protein